MSVQALAWVFDHSPSEGYDRLALLSLANHADRDGGHAYPSYRTIAEEARMSRRNAVYAIQRLEASGHIITLRGHGPRGTNVYLIVGMPSATSALVAALSGEWGSERDDISLVQQLHPNQKEEPLTDELRKIRDISEKNRLAGLDPDGNPLERKSKEVS